MTRCHANLIIAGVLACCGQLAIAGTLPDFDVVTIIGPLNGLTNQAIQGFDVDSQSSTTLLSNDDRQVFDVFPASIATRADGSVWAFEHDEGLTDFLIGRWDPVDRIWNTDLYFPELSEQRSFDAEFTSDGDVVLSSENRITEIDRRTQELRRLFSERESNAAIELDSDDNLLFAPGLCFFPEPCDRPLLRIASEGRDAQPEVILENFPYDDFVLESDLSAIGVLGRQLHRIDLETGNVDVIVEDERLPIVGLVEMDPLGRMFAAEFASNQLVWYSPSTGAVQSLELPDGMGFFQMVTFPIPPGLQAGDSDIDLDFDENDLVRVQIAGKYLTGQAATWGEGDWNGAPGGSVEDPPAGDGLFDQLDIIAALNAAVYLTGPYAAVQSSGRESDGQTSIGYDPANGAVWIDAPVGIELTSVNVDSVAGIFTGEPAQNLGGSFDNDADINIFKATFGGSFGTLSFGNVATAGLSRDFMLNDLTVVGSLAGGGALGEVDLIYVPEPPMMTLLAMALTTLAAFRRGG